MKTFKKILKWAGIFILLLLVAAGTFFFMYVRPVMQHFKHTETIQYDKDLTLVIGGGGNSGILVSDSIVLVIDTKMDEASEALYKKVKELAGDKPIVVINTHFHSDHLGGNKYFKGATIIAGENYGREKWTKEADQENMPNTWVKDQMDIKMGDDTATVYNIARAAHTASDMVVYLHKRKLLFAGDIILNGQVPALMGEADPAGYMAAFDLLPKKFDIKEIVPGHGPIGGIEVLNTFKQYFLDMETAAHDASKKDELVAKYKNWIQIPMLMSPGKTISVMQEQQHSK